MVSRAMDPRLQPRLLVTGDPAKTREPLQQDALSETQSVAEHGRVARSVRQLRLARKPEELGHWTCTDGRQHVNLSL